MSPELTYGTHISPPIPIATDSLVPTGERRMFSPLTTTLISGEQDAVLVDPPMTIAQTDAVGDWIERSGKRLTYIYLTHGHGDHWFGAGQLLRRFPGSTALATPGTIELLRFNGSAEFRAAFWDAQFPGQIPDLPIVATSPAGGVFEVEGQQLTAIPVGHSDTDSTTVLHVPSIDLVVAGDVVYNNVHQYLREAQGDGIAEWLEALDLVEALHPRSVVCGHKDGTRADDPENIRRTREYLLDAQRLLGTDPRPTAIEFFEAMLALHPDRLNTGALWAGATSLLGATT